MTAKPKLATLPDPGPLPGLSPRALMLTEKRISFIGLRCSDTLKAAVEQRALALGISVSDHFQILALRDLVEQAGPGLTRLNGPARDLELAAREARLAERDGTISRLERERIAKPATRGLSKMFEGRRA
jgi:hypothetical protein